MARAGNFNGHLNAALTVVMMICALIVTAKRASRMVRAMRHKGDGQEAAPATTHA